MWEEKPLTFQIKRPSEWRNREFLFPQIKVLEYLSESGSVSEDMDMAIFNASAEGKHAIHFLPVSPLSWNYIHVLKVCLYNNTPQDLAIWCAYSGLF